MVPIGTMIGQVISGIEVEGIGGVKIERTEIRGGNQQEPSVYHSFCLAFSRPSK